MDYKKIIEKSIEAINLIAQENQIYIILGQNNFEVDDEISIRKMAAKKSKQIEFIEKQIRKLVA